MFCSKCGKNIKEGDHFCGACGEKINYSTEKNIEGKLVVKPSVSDNSKSFRNSEKDKELSLRWCKFFFYVRIPVGIVLNLFIGVVASIEYELFFPFILSIIPVIFLVTLYEGARRKAPWVMKAIFIALVLDAIGIGFSAVRSAESTGIDSVALPFFIGLFLFGTPWVYFNWIYFEKRREYLIEE